jgi:hypothetical protein
MVQPISKQTTGVLIGKKAIAEYLHVSRDSFYEFIKLGLPAVVINNRYYAHKENIELWFQGITRQQTRTPQTDAE